MNFFTFSNHIYFDFLIFSAGDPYKKPMFPPKEASESGGGWRNHAPAIGVGVFVIISHFIWRGFQETEVFEGRGAKFPHSEVTSKFHYTNLGQPFFQTSCHICPPGIEMITYNSTNIAWSPHYFIACNLLG